MEALQAELAGRGATAIQATIPADKQTCVAFWASQGWRPAVKVFTQPVIPQTRRAWPEIIKQLQTVLKKR